MSLKLTVGCLRRWLNTSVDTLLLCLLTIPAPSLLRPSAPSGLCVNMCRVNPHRTLSSSDRLLASEESSLLLTNEAALCLPLRERSHYTAPWMRRPTYTPSWPSWQTRDRRADMTFDSERQRHVARRHTGRPCTPNPTPLPDWSVWGGALGTLAPPLTWRPCCFDPESLQCRV